MCFIVPFARVLHLVTPTSIQNNQIKIAYKSIIKSLCYGREVIATAGYSLDRVLAGGLNQADTVLRLGFLLILYMPLGYLLH